MSDIYRGLRILLVTADGHIRRANIGGRPQIIPDWAGRKVLGMTIAGSMQERQFLTLTHIDFSVYHLDCHGNLGPPDMSTIALMPTIPGTHGSAVVPSVLPNEVQRGALEVYLTQHWPYAMADPASRALWHRVTQGPPRSSSSRFRWAAQPFHED